MSKIKERKFPESTTRKCQVIDLELIDLRCQSAILKRARQIISLEPIVGNLLLDLAPKSLGQNQCLHALSHRFFTFGHLFLHLLCVLRYEMDVIG